MIEAIARLVLYVFIVLGFAIVGATAPAQFKPYLLFIGTFFLVVTVIYLFKKEQ